ncbi:MAG: hypothetical protein MJA27_18500 [Pseudanabaenales cyanobacterium]|nr:hypothetical protein [Pseudanabaenales cyanobacterium]
MSWRGRDELFWGWWWFDSWRGPDLSWFEDWIELLRVINLLLLDNWIHWLGVFCRPAIGDYFGGLGASNRLPPLSNNLPTGIPKWAPPIR